MSYFNKEIKYDCTALVKAESGKNARLEVVARLRLASLDSSVISLTLDATFPFREGIGKDRKLPAPPEPSLKGKVPRP